MVSYGIVWYCMVLYGIVWYRMVSSMSYQTIGHFDACQRQRHHLDCQKGEEKCQKIQKMKKRNTRVKEKFNFGDMTFLVLLWLNESKSENINHRSL